MDLVEAIDTLYGADPAGFVATRTALAREARAAGHKDVAAAITALRKPSVAASIINALARTDPHAVQRVRDLGERLRTAQSQLDAATLTALRPERDALLDDVAEAAVRAATRLDAGPPSPAVRDEIRATFVAALADAAASDVVASGHLTRALSYAGFGEVDLDGAVVRLPTRATSRTTAPSEAAHGVDDTGDAQAQARRDHETAVAAATDDLDRSERALAQAQLAAADAHDAAAAATARVDELTALLERARGDADAARRRADTARADVNAAQADVSAARATLNALTSLD